MSQRFAYPNLWAGCVGAWCPSRDRSRSTILTDFSGWNGHGEYKTQTGFLPEYWVVDGGRFALEFATTNDRRVDCGDKYQYKSMSAGLSVSAWFATTSTGSGASRNTILNKGGGTSSEGGYRLCIDAGRVWAAFSDGDGGSRPQKTGTNTYNDGAWHHVVMRETFANSSGLSVYIDGLDDGMTLDLSSISDASGDYELLIATTSPISYNNQYFNGTLDDLRLYDRVLTVAEIRQLYTLGRGGAYRLAPRKHYVSAGAAPPAATVSPSLIHSFALPRATNY